MPVRRGYKHIWGYKGVWREYKIRPGLWKFTFKATKSKKAKDYGPVGKGSEFGWKFEDVKQKAVKGYKGRYNTVMTGYKRFNYSKVK